MTKVKFDSNANLIFLDVIVSGKQKDLLIRLAMDTGAAATVIVSSIT